MPSITLARSLRSTLYTSSSILALFAQGEQGVWYDPSDLTTLFQDTAGTTPVTTTGQSVGLMLDKSKGLVLGPELVTNGDFDTADGWALAASAVISDGVLNVNQGGSTELASQNIGIAPGRFYEFEVECKSYISGSLDFGTRVGTVVTFAVVNAVGIFRGIGVAGAANTGIRLISQSGGFIGTIDNISVKELPGNHATQATAAARPTYQTGGGLHWLAFDGVDDFMVAPNHPFSFTGSVSAFIAFSKSGDTTFSTLFSAGTNGVAKGNGVSAMAFQAISAGWSTDIWQPSGVRAGPAIVLNTPYVGVFNIQNWSLHRSSGTEAKVNSISYTPTVYGTGDPTALNSGPMRIGSFDPPALGTGFFNGKLFGIVVRNVASTTAQIQSTEMWVNTKTGAY
jgi:hypothetical protein